MGQNEKFPTSLIETTPDTVRFSISEEDKQAMWAAVDEAAKRPPPTMEEVLAAKLEYDFLFNEDNSELSQAIYDQGSFDVTHCQPKTPAALFYGHVSELVGIQGRFEALRPALVIESESS